MASVAPCSLGGSPSIKVLTSSMNINKPKFGRAEMLSLTKPAYTRQKPVQFARLVQPPRPMKPLLITCGSSTESANNADDGLEEKKVISTTRNFVPTSLQLETLLTEICKTSIAEFDLKLGGFQLYVMRNMNDKTMPAVAPSPLPIVPEGPSEKLDSNGSVSSFSLAISKSKSSAVGIQSLLDSASDEGLVVLQSPKVGYFRRSRTIKGKRAPPSCKEKQIVKEGQVLCYVEQLGGEIPIESDVSGEVIKILRKDGEPVGYGDALIAILPSFPGIKKLQ